MPRREELEPLTPLEDAQDASLMARIRDEMIRRSIPKGSGGNSGVAPGKLPRARYLNQPIKQTPGGGVRSKNAANIEDLRFLEDHPDKPGFARGLELLNRHRLDRGAPALDRLGVAKEYPTSLASMMILDAEKARKKALLAAQPPYQWAQPGASTGAVPGAIHNWQPR